MQKIGDFRENIINQELQFLLSFVLNSLKNLYVEKIVCIGYMILGCQKRLIHFVLL